MSDKKSNSWLRRFGKGAVDRSGQKYEVEDKKSYGGQDQSPEAKKRRRAAREAARKAQGVSRFSETK
jgi:hypothetical protein